MSFLSILAENAALLDSVKDEEWREKLARFAGKYEAKRCQISGSKATLYFIIAGELEALAKSCGFSFTFRDQRQIANVKTEFARYMIEFEKVRPGKGVLLVVDELLHYLQSRRDDDLVIDLSVLQALGEFSNGTRFAFMAGIQQSLFNNPRFNHVASEINRVKQRFYDLVIDNKGVGQLIERYLFQKDAAQRAQIRDLLLSQSKLFEIIGPDIEQFVALFPAHPRFIEEFQRVFVVERREILTILSQEARALADHQVAPDHVCLITSDRYWKHIQQDQGLNANRDILQVKQNLSVLKARIQSEFSVQEDKPAAERLIEALAVNRLTTTSISEAVGLTPQDLKNNLLWKTRIPMENAAFLTSAAKRLLDRTRQAANGQFLAVSETSGQWYIDPTRTVDYDQDVATYADTLPRTVIQRYLNEIFTRALELENEQPVQEGRLWNYTLQWTDRNVERPGWLCFNFPNQRSTAKPPKDFYLFIIPSKRVTGLEDTLPNNQDEAYWFVEDFPAAKCDLPSTLGESDPETWLDLLRKYAAARERALSCQPGNEKTAFNAIAARHLKAILPAFGDSAGDWISVQWNGQRKKFREWVAELDPSKANAPFKSKVDAISQIMFAPWFDSKYPDYPAFPIRVQEGTRKQNAQAALQILCEVGMVASNGRAILNGLGLYKGDAFAPDQSRWLTKVRARLKPLGGNQFINHSELFDRVDERWWFKGEVIEAEWLHVVLTAGVKTGDMVVFGQANRRYDASNLQDFFNEVKSFEGIVRVGKPSEIPFDLWTKLFELFQVNKGLLANPSTHEKAMIEFGTAVHKRVNECVQWEQEVKSPLPFLSDDARAVLSKSADAFRGAKLAMEQWLAPINTKAKMQNLKMIEPNINDLADRLSMSLAVADILAFIRDHQTALSALERFEGILAGRPLPFFSRLEALKTRLDGIYRNPKTLEDQADALKGEIRTAVEEALKSYHTLHKKYRLDKQGDDRKKKLVSGPRLKQLNKLVHIKTLGRAKLEDLRRGFESLITCGGCSDDDVLRSAKSLCPKCSFNPSELNGGTSATDAMTESEQAVEALHTTWTKQLLKELQDPSVQASLQALKQEERDLVTGFLTDKALPADITDAFINAINTALIGLKRRPVKRDDLADAILGDGSPLKPDELRERFEKWLKEQIGPDDRNTVRFVLEK